MSNSAIRRIDVHGIRNLSCTQLAPSEQVNILFGANGSGKTSFLEAIHYAALGRSFRSARVESVICTDLAEATVFIELFSGTSIGVNKSRVGAHTLKLRGERQPSWLDTARSLPLLLINSDSFALLEGSSKVRRKFLDWGVFHVEHDFSGTWRGAARCIAQRNLLLKSRNLDERQIDAWSVELAAYAESIDRSRARYLERLLPVLEDTLAHLLDVPALSIKYSRGWDEGSSLLDVLRGSLERDARYGATQVGPHRADLQIRIGKFRAEDYLSRGQQKLLVIALKLAQGRLLSELGGSTVVYLVDDLPSELDSPNRVRVCRLLEGFDSQTFMTCVGENDLDSGWSSATSLRKFHVEHGKMSAFSSSSGMT
jgi:DNA replication and repair protein RecF